MEFGRDRSPGGRPDVMENVLWEHGMRLEGPDLYPFQAIHQESIVVPETSMPSVLGLTVTACFSGLLILRFAVFVQLLADLDRVQPRGHQRPRSHGQARQAYRRFDRHSGSARPQDV